MSIQKKFLTKFNLEDDDEVYASQFLPDNPADPAVYSVDNPLQGERTYNYYLFSVISK